MNQGNVPSSLKSNPYIRIDGKVLICGGPGHRHRAFPTGVRLPNGDVLVGYRVARDHWMTADGAFYTARSSDNGRTWQTSVAVAALPGWGVNGVIGQYPDGVMPADEPVLRAALQLYRWDEELPAGKTWRENPVYWIFSNDYGDTWGKMVKVHDTIAEVETDCGTQRFWGLWLHSNESTQNRLSDGRLMGLFVGRSDLMCYNPSTTYESPSDTPMAGFSTDNGITWTFRTIAHPADGIGFSESDSVRLPSGRVVAIYGNNAGSPWFFETHSDNEGQSWELLGNLHDQTNWDMGYPDLIKLANGQILCVYYTGNQRRPIPKALEEKLAAIEPIRTIFKGKHRPAAFGEIQSEIRGAILDDISVDRFSAPDNEMPVSTENTTPGDYGKVDL